MKNSQSLQSRIFTFFTVTILIFALNVTGALGWFFRTFDWITANWVPNPAEFLFGLGSDLTGGGFSFGYGYGYGSGDFDAGFTAPAPGASSSGGGGSSSSSSSSGSSSSGSSSSSSSSSSGTPENIDVNKFIAELRDLKQKLSILEQRTKIPEAGLQLPAILPQTGKTVAEKGIAIVKNPSVETNFPTWFKPSSLSNAPTDAQYWINTIPYVEDRNENSYVVVPTSGIVAPIESSNSRESQKAINGQSFDYATPLSSGVGHYPGTQKPGEVGTSVLYGHSSDYTRNPGRYKTVFGKIIELDAGEEVWVYNRQADWSFERLRFVVNTSREITPTTTNILLPRAGRNLTLFTCTPIWGISGRWFVNATLVWDTSNKVLDLGLESSIEEKIDNAMNRFRIAISRVSQSDRERFIAMFAYRIEQYESRYVWNIRAQNILRYMNMKLAGML